MDDRIIGAALVIIGLSIAALGGTMSSLEYAIYYIVGFLAAFAGLGFFIKYYRISSLQNEDES